MIQRVQYMERLKAFKDNKLIKVITGLRRCGKSTLLQLFKQDLLASGVVADNIIDVNFELMAYDHIREYRRFYKLVRDRMPVAPFIWHNFIREFTRDINADTIEKGVEVYKYFGFDIILRTCTIGGVLDFSNEHSDNWRVDTLKDSLTINLPV